MFTVSLPSYLYMLSYATISMCSGEYVESFCHAGNVTAISSKAVAAKAAAKSAADDLQGDTDKSAAVTQSQMPVDVAAQLQQAQQLAQQQAADFKQNNEGSTARLDASGSTTAGAGSILGLGTGSSSAADPTALSADASTMDPAEKLQLAQQHQSQQAGTFKKNIEGTAARLDSASNAAAASAAAFGTNTSRLESASKEAVSSSNNTGTSHSGLVAGDMPDAKHSLANAEGTKSASDLNGLGQTANAADATKSLGKSAGGSNTSTGAAAASNASIVGASDSTNEASSSNSTATGGESQLVAQSQEAGQQQAKRVSSVDQNASADAQALANSVSVTR